ncbi:nucleotide sugar dehydrogenase [Amycolatopsis thermophila]|uniref:Nucleotide sugar dehydrogenase n=1 Tax=Amycolatopsis thermophila TaxID=206084 RepID=A0ABU0F6I0_9PSEU|nr:nucleotide sugar dehydrogenase [Amycolatopsis thermophila]MDQ0382645.1 nucleotide sugar dehydrogenase [Amycolatopsis thermophila]
MAIVGLGYVGLPTALAFAEAGRQVVGFDISESRLADIKADRADLLASDHQRLARHLSERLEITNEPTRLSEVGAIVVCVPTPVDEHLVPDLGPLHDACVMVAEAAMPGQTIVLTSTTYVGSTRDLLVAELEARELFVGRDVFVAFSPERIDPGDANHVPERTPRVVGGVTDECTRRAIGLLADSAPVVHVVSSPEAAEATKLLENTFRAVNIAFANEFASAVRSLDLDPMEIITAAATKPFGFMPFYPGPGVGGHCIPCDPHYLLWELRRRRVSSPITEAAMTAIAHRPLDVVRRAQEVLADNSIALFGARVLVVGVAYKPGVADVRESPALEIIAELNRRGADVHFTDPLVDQIRVGEHVMTADAPEGSWDLVIVHTAHPGLDLDWLADEELVLDATYRLTLPHLQVL